MKKSKEILIWGSTLLCIYFVAWLIFTLDIFSKGKDIENNLKKFSIYDMIVILFKKAIHKR